MKTASNTPENEPLPTWVYIVTVVVICIVASWIQHW